MVQDGDVVTAVSDTDQLREVAYLAPLSMTLSEFNGQRSHVSAHFNVTLTDVLCIGVRGERRAVSVRLYSLQHG